MMVDLNNMETSHVLNRKPKKRIEVLNPAVNRVEDFQRCKISLMSIYAEKKKVAFSLL